MPAFPVDPNTTLDDINAGATIRPAESRYRISLPLPVGLVRTLERQARSNGYSRSQWIERLLTTAVVGDRLPS